LVFFLEKCFYISSIILPTQNIEILLMHSSLGIGNLLLSALDIARVTISPRLKGKNKPI